MVAMPECDVPMLEGAVRELRRELALRRNVYVRLIARGSLTPNAAQLQWRRMKVAHDVLMAVLAAAPILHPHELERDYDPNVPTPTF
jgi:hypothetical protein